MKLDYLQFLELEVFTRFGSQLEASMEARIRRGQLLREILKQERLDSAAGNSSMAWLVAYNEGLLDGRDAAGCRRTCRLCDVVPTHPASA